MQRGGRTREGRYYRAPETRTQNREKQREPLYLKEDNAQLEGSRLSSWFTAQQLIFGDFSDSEAHLMLELSKKDEIYSSKLSQQVERFQKELSEKEEMLQKPQLEIQELSEQCASCRLKALQLEVENQGLQYPREDNTQLQTDLADSRQKFGDLQEEFNKKQSDTKEHHLLDLSKKDEICRREVSQQAEEFQKKLPEKEEILQKHLSEKDESLLELQRLRQENTQLQTYLADRRQRFGDLQKEFKETLAQINHQHMLELWNRQQSYCAEFSKQVKKFQKELSEKEEMLQKHQLETQESSMQIASWHLKALQLEAENQGLQHLREENNQLQKKLSEKEEILQKHLSEKDESLLELQRLRQENTQLQTDLADSRQKFGDLQEEFNKEQSDTKERHLLDLSKRSDPGEFPPTDEICRREVSQQAEEFQKELFEKEEILQKHLSEKDESLLELQRLRQENTQLQTDLADSRQKFGDLQEEFNKEQSDTKERHLLDLSKRSDPGEFPPTDEICRREVSQQAEEFQKELSEKEEILQKHLSEKDESLLELQRLRQENTQLQLLLMEKPKKEKKKNFFSRMFKLKKKIRDSFKPSSA